MKKSEIKLLQVVKKKFPKKIPNVNLKLKKIYNNFMRDWHLELLNKKKYSFIEKFNHNYVAKSPFINSIYSQKNKINTLELGSGIGTHIKYENLNFQKYYAMELRKNMLSQIKLKYRNVNCILGNIQKKMSFTNEYFHRIIAVHVLEHLNNLPKLLNEVYRILKKNGIFQVVIPCDPGLLYKFARKLSAQRLFKKKYKLNYKNFIKTEHINSPYEILVLLKEKFIIIDKSYYPFLIPIKDFNLCIGVTLVKK